MQLLILRIFTQSVDYQRDREAQLVGKSLALIKEKTFFTEVQEGFFDANVEVCANN